jgi:hypothetical protein
MPERRRNPFKRGEFFKLFDRTFTPSERLRLGLSVPEQFNVDRPSVPGTADKMNIITPKKRRRRRARRPAKQREQDI